MSMTNDKKRKLEGNDSKLEDKLRARRKTNPDSCPARGQEGFSGEIKAPQRQSKLDI